MFGNPQKFGKFYKGASNDTPWNKDLLWRKHVAKETCQMKVNMKEMIETPQPIYARAQKMKMGITGTLIPDILTPPTTIVDTLVQSTTETPDNRRYRQSSSSRSSRSSRSSSSSWSSSSRSTSSSFRSTSSTQYRQLKHEMNQRALEIQDQATHNMDLLRQEMQAEKHRREQAEKTLDLLCTKLGITQEEL